MNKESLQKYTLIIIFLLVISIMLFLFRYTDFILIMLLFELYVLFFSVGFLAMLIIKFKKNKKMAIIYGVFMIISATLSVKMENIVYYINTHHIISNYLENNETYKGAKIIGLANKNLRITGNDYWINYIYNIKMPDGKIIQGYYYLDTSGPFGGPSKVETNYLYRYKNELVKEFNEKYNENIFIDFELSNNYVIEYLTYTLGNEREILDFIDFVDSKNPGLEYSIKIKDPVNNQTNYYYTGNIKEYLMK